MRVMIFVKATEGSEEGIKDTPEMAKMFEDMGRFNQELIKAGIMKDGDGLKPSSEGKRVHFNGTQRTVKDGPFPANEVVAGFWIWDVKDMNEAVEWVKKCPNPMMGPSDIEIRPFYEMGDLTDFMSPEAKKLHKA
jgi:hypothetical protein